MVDSINKHICSIAYICDAGRGTLHVAGGDLNGNSAGNDVRAYPMDVFYRLIEGNKTSSYVTLITHIYDALGKPIDDIAG